MNEAVVWHTGCLRPDR